ncbi:MAG TPA: hypothetical protein VI759_03160 [Dehalococcoidia bacterium]|nr:hypothetical protein [Dehalococcoidia bacterium]
MFRFLNARFYYGWVIVAVAGLINVASSPLNTAVFSFFVDPMSDDLGWTRGALSLGFSVRLIVGGSRARCLARCSIDSGRGCWACSRA